MLKRFSYFFACMLLLLIPLQGTAAANMSICSSMMHSNAQKMSQDVRVSHDMPCHDDMNSKQLGEKNTCKTSCATLCANLNAMMALPSMTSDKFFLVSTQLVNFPQQVYLSITQPNLQRPPISFI